jgi:hypothetical protein
LGTPPVSIDESAAAAAAVAARASGAKGDEERREDDRCTAGVSIWFSGSDEGARIKPL